MRSRRRKAASHYLFPFRQAVVCEALRVVKVEELGVDVARGKRLGGRRGGRGRR